MPVPVLPGLKSRGDGLVQARGTDVEVNRWTQEELASKAKDVYPVLINSSRMMFMVRGALCGADAL
jgi:hypothetical protein